MEHRRIAAVMVRAAGVFFGRRRILGNPDRHMTCAGFGDAKSKDDVAILVVRWSYSNQSGSQVNNESFFNGEALAG